MKRSLFVLAASLVALLAGCVPSFHPVYQEADLIYDPAFLGTYRMENSSASWKVTAGVDKSYRLLLTDEDGKQAHMIGRIAEIDGVRFFDLAPDDVTIHSNDFGRLHVMPLHTVYLLKETTDKVVLSVIDFRWLNEQLSGSSPPISYVAVGDRKVITASTEELQQFLLKHRDRFTGEVKLFRQI